MRPRSPEPGVGDASGSDDDLPAIKSDRFRALIERKKQERLEREAAEQAHREKLASELEQLGSDEDNDSGITDDEGGRRLTQEARPTRKASKKAIEEMNRETQRMARNMQLAHEARTRKRISKASLFEKFNYRPAGEGQPEPKTRSSSRPTTPQTDVEMKNADTPPSSPPVAKGQEGPSARPADLEEHDTGDGDMPSLDQVLDAAARMQPTDKGKGKAPAVDAGEVKQATPKPKRRVRVRFPMAAPKASTLTSDDELEVLCTVEDKVAAVFNRVPANKCKEPRSLRALRALAQVKSPGKQGRQKDDRSCMTAAELRAQLYGRARQQARLERDRRLEILKAKGILIQTADERERQEQEVEDLVAKAREEAEKIMQQERAAAKEEGDEDGAADPLAWDDSEDGEYDAAANEADGEASAIELSGSEDEQEADNEEQSADEGGAANFFDKDASSGESDEGEEVDPQEEAEHVEDVGGLSATRRGRARKQHTTVLSDDEAEIKTTPRPKALATQTTPAEAKTASPAAPTSVLRSAKKSFIPGLPVNGPAGLGLTQIFAGTMDESQRSQRSGPTQSMLPDLDQFPDSNFSATAAEPMEDVVLDTQTSATQGPTQGIKLNLSQSQMRGLGSLLADGINTQMTDSIEPSQDAGLQKQTPLKERFIEPPFSTVETVTAADNQDDDFVHDSPLVRRGRLRRKMDMSVAEEEPTRTIVENAFEVMTEGARKENKQLFVDRFDRKKTKAKDMVEEQAQESEDEYAGLGGADGEESDNESTGSLKEIIDDDENGNIDERALAAFYADRERAADEKEVEKLFKDITTGMLRRKRGADYDLSDSDDGGEARRKMKRRQFAKMQKALYSDERVKKIAENPGNKAFLRTIEDRGSDDEMDILDITADAPDQAETQSQSREDGDDAEERPQPKTIPDSQPERQPLGPAPEHVRAPAHMRRTAGTRKPSNLGQVRETLSGLLEERQDSVIPATEVGSESDEADDEEDDEAGAPGQGDKENQAPPAAIVRRSSVAVVDRISLKRSGSSLSASSTRLAFAAHSASTPSFKVPALLRRATTNSTLLSGSTSSGGGGGGSSATAATAGGGAFGEDGKIKKAAGKRSGVNGLFARAGDERPKSQGGEGRRELKKARGAAKRIGVVGGLLGSGSFG
ncbi:hypothetical protein CDD83_5326 [Cordyceps sp. RAO-2017]|nr:hypothetical protein CDD83_5326 [Cordyceps sp. RAO-2017]